MKPDEDDFGSSEHDAPDRRVADCERVPEPLPEQIAHTRTVRGSLPQAPMFFQKGRDSRCSHPSQVARALQEAIGDTVVYQNCTTRGSQIPVAPDCIEFQNPRVLYGTLTMENSYAGCQPVLHSQLLAGFIRATGAP